MDDDLNVDASDTGLIAWRCDRCSTTIMPGQGAVMISETEVSRARDASLDWEQAHAEQIAMTLAELVTRPDPASWHVLHDSCADPDLVDNAYRIEVQRCADFRALTAWTSHLLGKPWLADTDWRDLLERTAGDVSRL